MRSTSRRRSAGSRGTRCPRSNTRSSTSATSSITPPHFPAGCAGRLASRSDGWARGDFRRTAGGAAGPEKPQPAPQPTAPGSPRHPRPARPRDRRLPPGPQSEATLPPIPPVPARPIAGRSRLLQRTGRGVSPSGHPRPTGRILPILSSSKFGGSANEVRSSGRRLPPYNDLWRGHYERREPCARRILPSPPGGSTAAPPRSFSTTSSSPTTDPSAAPGPADPACSSCRRAPHLALGCLQVLARCPVPRGGPVGPDRHPARLRRVAPPAQRRPGRELAPPLAPPAAAPGRRPGPDPLPWPAAGRPRRDLSLPGQERHQPLPRLRHAVCHPPRLSLHRRLDGRQRRRAAGGDPRAPAPPGGRGRRPLPLVAAGSWLLQRGGHPLSPGGAAPVLDAGDLPGPQARRSAGAERDQRLPDLGEERLSAPTPCTMPTSGRPGSRSVSSAATIAASGGAMASSGWCTPSGA